MEKCGFFLFSLGVCSMELRNLVSSLEYLVSNERQVLLGGIRLGGSATKSKAGNMYYTCPNNFPVIYLAFPLMLGSMFV